MAADHPWGDVVVDPR